MGSPGTLMKLSSFFQMAQLRFNFKTVSKFWILDKICWRGTCQLCPPDGKTHYSFSESSYSNLVRHSVNHHKEEIIQKIEAENASKTNQKQSNLGSWKLAALLRRCPT